MSLAFFSFSSVPLVLWMYRSFCSFSLVVRLDLSGRFMVLAPVVLGVLVGLVLGLLHLVDVLALVVLLVRLALVGFGILLLGAAAFGLSDCCGIGRTVFNCF